MPIIYLDASIDFINPQEVLQH